MSIGLFVLRIVAGLVFAAHGAQKLFGMFGGHGLSGSGAFFESLGYRPGRAMAALAGVSEVGGGLLLAAGFLTPLGAAAVIGVMINAIVSAKIKAGLIGGYELDLLYAAAALALAFTGPGVYAVDHVLGLALDGWRYGVGALALGGVAAVMVLASRRRTPATVAEQRAA